MPHGHADLGELTPQSIFYDQGRFGRLFPTLPPFAADTPLAGMRSKNSARPAAPWILATTCPTRSH